MTFPGAEQMARRSESPCNAPSTIRLLKRARLHANLERRTGVAATMASEGILRVAALALVIGLLVAIVLAVRRRVQPGEARLGLWQHLDELRRRILIVAGTALGGTVLALTVRIESRPLPLLGSVPIPMLALYDTLSAQLFRIMAAHLLPAGVQLVVTSPMDGFQAQFDIALAVGVLIALPVLLLQFSRFVGPALNPRERRFLRIALWPAALLFLLAAA